MSKKRVSKGKVLVALIKGNCPRCHESKQFSNAPYSLKFMEMPETCPSCGHRLEVEPGFWHGAMYVSYMIIVACLVTCFVGFHVIFEMSLFWVGAINLSVIIFGLPLISRSSRILYSYIFTRFSHKANSYAKSNRIHKRVALPSSYDIETEYL